MGLCDMPHNMKDPEGSMKRIILAVCAIAVIALLAMAYTPQAPATPVSSQSPAPGDAPLKVQAIARRAIIATAHTASIFCFISLSGSFLL